MKIHSWIGEISWPEKSQVRRNPKEPNQEKSQPVCFRKRKIHLTEISLPLNWRNLLTWEIVTCLFQEEEDPLNSSLTPMDWLPRLNAKAGMVEVDPYFSILAQSISYHYFGSIFLWLNNCSSQYFSDSIIVVFCSCFTYNFFHSFQIRFIDMKDFHRQTYNACWHWFLSQLPSDTIHTSHYHFHLHVL